ncbi:hypothetical protein [Methanobrevibacter olleyae]|uniref:Uncharacterized protein n=1 Tax=Methanobrevibacter olleyae TaxID=294671 RepID=A0A126QWY3_METOL|nr:hypothetical protein [Methanobrevibacter olleyae]AMK14640.1 hypothetical protein YLM1_0080 [Methanobrevibacter olleyae]SFL26393.1 hypothetical protein SAMN02910297_00372 [Methanobrevibacter olleyae]
MDKKIAIIIIVVFCLLCVCSYLIFEPGRNITYHQINLTNSCSAQVPLTDKSSTYTDNLDIIYYCDYDYGLNITSFNNGSPVTASQGLLRFENIKQETLGSEKKSDAGFTYYKNNNLGTYTVFVEDKKSNNFILISSKDLTILTKVYNSLEARIIVTDDELEDMHSGNSSNNSSSYY